LALFCQTPFCFVTSACTDTYTRRHRPGMAWFKNGRFRVTVDGEWVSRPKGIAAGLDSRAGGINGSVATESRVVEHLQPVRMALAGQEFGGTSADAFGPITAKEPSVVQEEP
jgi:hypothetical protein